ncbi:MAG: glycosyltransferase [Candidatus Eremiobacteraeota bacterium]|nr:glycosyltransferase [Candidatus Eremiobacteraeota bacterium]
MMELFVVIPTYNRLDTLEYVIPSLLDQDIAKDRYEIIVADSNSTDGTARFFEAIAPVARNVRHLPAAYSGRAAARNAGIDAASGKVILFNDADIIASPDLLTRHLQRHSEQRDIAVVGQEVQVRSLEEYRTKRYHPELRDPLHPARRKRLSWLYFLTGNASVRRADLMRVGAFDESFTGYGHEDLELGYRLEQAGIAICYEPRAVSYHLQDVPHEDQKQKMQLAGRSTVRFYRKHPHFAVMANLGMTPLSLGLHSLVMKMPGFLQFLDRRAESSAFARNIVQQYHYVSGIKSALAAQEGER